MIASIRLRLTVYLLCGVGLLIVAAGAALQINMSRWLEREFDRSLETAARALVTLTKQEAGTVELDFADEIMPEFESSLDAWYFELWVDGSVLIERSRSFSLRAERSQAFLPREPELAVLPRFMDARLPDGRLGRRVRIDFVPQDEHAHKREMETDGPPSSGQVLLDPSKVAPGSGIPIATILVARERERLDARSIRLRWSFFGFTALLLATLAVLIAISLNLGLRPLDRLVDQVRELEAESLDRRVEAAEQPRELAPVVDQLNQLLARLENAFRRERRLTGDIAHELKTPIAELRSLCEVGSRWPEDPDAARKFFEDAWTISRQMERIVTHMLALARYEEGLEQVRTDRVDLAEILREAWQPLENHARRKALTLETRLPENAVLETDREKLCSILSNLLSNAVQYSRPGTAIACVFATGNGRIRVTISNWATQLEATDVPHMFDRFWRKDAARSSGSNAGLGLALVKVFSELLGFEIETSLEPDGLLEISLTRLA